MGTLFSCLSQIVEAARIPWLASISKPTKACQVFSTMPVPSIFKGLVITLAYPDDSG